MSQISILSPGKSKEAWQKMAAQEYIRRLSRYCDLHLIELPDAPDSLPLQKALEQEGEAILRRVSPRDYLISLDIKGRRLSSEEFSALLQDAMTESGGHLAFAIGGSRGLSPEVLKASRQRLSFSPMTFTHLMARVILLEQIYRAYKISSGEPYHK